MNDPAVNLNQISMHSFADTSTGIRISRDYFTFSAAHFAQLHDGTSERLHGHNYNITFELSSEVDSLGYVIDFTFIKKIIKELVLDLNHKVLIPLNSKRLSYYNKAGSTYVDVDGKSYTFPTDDVFMLPVCNTTCEEIARYLAESLFLHKFKGNIKVEVAEQPNQSAFYTLRNSDG